MRLYVQKAVDSLANNFAYVDTNANSFHIAQLRTQIPHGSLVYNSAFLDRRLYTKVGSGSLRFKRTTIETLPRKRYPDRIAEAEHFGRPRIIRKHA